MIIIVGLGNPESDYVNTRHNAGFLVIDELQKMKLPKNVILRKSNVFMNESGKYVLDLLKKHKGSSTNLYIIHDDLDIALGSFKIQFGTGPKDHNGVKSVDDELGTNGYWHVRIGIDNRPSDNRVLGEEYVLQNFTTAELKKLGITIKEVCKKLINNLQLTINN